MAYYPQESLYKPYKYHGYTVRGTPNCPLNQACDIQTKYIQKIYQVFLLDNRVPSAAPKQKINGIVETLVETGMKPSFQAKK